jgi:hypothetical protein
VDGPRDPLTADERAVLRGDAQEPKVAGPTASERLAGLRALAEGDELAAVGHFQRAREASQRGSLDWAVNERLYGLALIRALREVEGTFALERADALLDELGYERFTLDD